MSFTPFNRLILLLPVFTLSSLSLAGSPPSNTIPIIADRPNDDEVDLDVFCMLSWHFFDALQSGDGEVEDISSNLLPPAGETGMFICMNPIPTARWGHWPNTWAARMSDYSFSSATAYARPVWKGITIVISGDTVTFQKDTLIAIFTAPEIKDSLEASAVIMNYYFGDEEQIWFYNTFDEAPSRQWSHMVHDSISGYYEVDDYIPNLYTQARHLVGSDSLPTFEEADPEGIFSWLKYTMEQEDPTHPVVTVFAFLHTITWAGAPVSMGTFLDQANSVRSFLNMEYQGYGFPDPPVIRQNRPAMFVFDAYPVRQVGVSWLSTHSYYDNHVSADLDTILLGHFEEGMDSTCIPVRQTALEQERDIPILYYPQAIGRCGGDVMWNLTGTALNYTSYQYRIPTPQEFLMNCNIALIRDIRGLFPYCVKTYYSLQSDGKSAFMAGFLDQNNIPFDAPYEEWVYTDRWRTDYDVIPPDSFPPFSDSCRLCDDFDPLWDLPDRPTTTSQRSVEDYMMWKFNAYGRLWNSMRDTFGQIATVAPELTQLHWWMDKWGEDFSQCLEIIATDNPYDLIEPEIRLFNDGNDNAYSYYVNRNCYDATNPLAVIIYPDLIPSGFDYNSSILDHSRRFLIEMETDLDYDYHFFRDTLDAGQGRLVQFFTGNLPADVRITKSDIEVSSQVGSSVYFADEYSFPAERQTYIAATFYNMGTFGKSDVIATLTDLTDEVVLDRDTISFSGLSGTLYQCDDQTVSFSWQPGSGDIGIHILEIAAESFTGEPDPNDNSTTVVFQITPRDYATTVLNEPWNMDDDTPPAWHTNDITSLPGWSSTFTDSISGMFEGTLSDPSQTNRLVLNVGSSWSSDISTGQYDHFSMIARAECELTVTVHWQDENLQNHSIVLSETVGEDWNEMEPVDLTAGFSGWADRDAIKLWLEFSSATNIPRDIRIGWIRLTE